jgi:hypothetical protein
VTHVAKYEGIPEERDTSFRKHRLEPVARIAEMDGLALTAGMVEVLISPEDRRDAGLGLRGQVR